MRGTAVWAGLLLTKEQLLVAVLTELAGPTERTSLVMTTNLPFEAWPEVCRSERLTGAVLDRLAHRVHILEANGESYRLRESKRRLKARKG